ncbi:MAG: GNAT family N-acetyltransferase [Phycisphaerales bacterium]|nr:GNAT family N-acetyltransferase [Phycisphaerales bacterium]
MTTTLTAKDWRQRYADKVCSAESAIAKIRPGDTIYLSAGSAAPVGLLPALVSPTAPTVDNRIVHLLTLGDAPYARPEMAGRFRHNALFIGPNVRAAVSDGRADYTPVFLSEIPGLIRKGRIPIDVCLLNVSPPDEDGLCTLGTHIDIAPAACAVSRLIIAQVNSKMPATCGDTKISVEKIHALVAADTPLPTLPQPKIREETEQIARNIADLIPDGATLQLGIGGIPDAVLKFLADRKDLGIHTEMFSDGVVELVERGVINCKRKNLHPGKIVASFLMGTQRVYDFVHNNPMVELYPVDYTNDPFVVAQNDNMVAINTCLEVDLTGQVCSDSIGQSFYSGIGGQVDFIRGAARSRGGVPIIALPSTASGGIISRIVPRLDDGAGVVTTRGDVHWVVTEFGAVNLHGLNVRERALALVSIAHPKFRPWLLAEAKQRKLAYIDQIEPKVRVPLYPRQLETRARTRDGEEFLIRPIKPTDESLLKEMFYDLSRESIYQRFFATRKTMPHENLQLFCNIDYDHDMTLVASIRRGDVETIVGWAAYVHDPESQLADASFLVVDSWQGRGIGTALMRRLTEIAEARGILGFTAAVLTGNARMLRVFEKCGYPMQSRVQGDVTEIKISFEETRAEYCTPAAPPAPKAKGNAKK